VTKRTNHDPANHQRTVVADFASADENLQPTLESLDGASNYAGWIFGLLAPSLGAEVLEVGAGHGTFSDRVAPHVRRLVALDLSERCAEILRERFAERPNVEVVHGDIGAAARLGPFDTAILVNVLEHIEDDDTVLRQLHDLLRPGGRLVLWVPAFPALYSHFDRKIGHYRRYRRPTLTRQLDSAGFDVLTARYVNLLGAFAWFLVVRVAKRLPASPRTVLLLDRFVVPVVRFLERFWKVPVGQSLFVVAKRTSA